MNRDRLSRKWKGDTTKKQRLKSFGGLTFFKDFWNSSINADYSVGSPIGTFTRSAASDICTYVNSDGVIQSASGTALPRYQGGYYDATGFHTQSGLMIEATATNLVPKSQVFNDAVWTASVLMTVGDNETSSPDGTVNAGILASGDVNSTLILTTSVTARTFSVWLKRSAGTGNVDITANGGTGWTTVTLSSSDWRRFQVTAASALQTCGIRLVTSGDEVYIWGAQFETSPYATSYIPTTSAAATRNAESLTYAIVGNRTAATESIFIKFAPESTFANDGVGRVLLSSDTKNRQFAKVAGGTVVQFKPNSTDSGTSLSDATTIPTANTSYVVTGIAYGATAATNSRIYMDGVSENFDITDYISPAWGTNFYIGSSNSGTTQLNGIIQSIAMFSDAKDATTVSTITNILNS